MHERPITAHRVIGADRAALLRDPVRSARQPCRSDLAADPLHPARPPPLPALGVAGTDSHDRMDLTKRRLTENG